MKVLIRCGYKRQLNPKAHIWDGEDTLCRMHSTGGLKSEKYMLIERSNDMTICSMCLVREEKIWDFIEGNIDWDEMWKRPFDKPELVWGKDEKK